MNYLQRNLHALLKETIKTRPLVYLNGPRQVGKSTLVQMFKNSNYVSFDSPIIVNSSKSNPEEFIKNLPYDKLNIIDEVQNVKEIFPYFKVFIDKNRIAGRSKGLYLLTGSANLMALPSLAESLVGRMSVLTLYPFSSCEIIKSNINFIDKLYSYELKYTKYQDYNIIDVITNATFPEIALDNNINRTKWFDDYLTTILFRDVKSVDDIRNPDKIIALLVSIAARVGSNLNKINIQKEIGLDNKTLDKYLGAIIKAFMTFEIKPWTKSINIQKRFTRAPKIYFSDTNFMCYLIKRDIKEIYRNDRIAMGHIFENFVATEIIKNISSLVDVEVSVFCPDGKEVDFAVEKSNGDTLAIEGKLDSCVSQKDFTNLNNMRNLLGSKFKKGILLYTGNELVPMGEKLWAVPICYLWNK
jgi:predicted AAA+ superfamily ATPase